MTLKGVKGDSRTATFVASTDTPDSDGDIVEQNWRLERFKSNPVILFGHDSRSLPIGRASDVGMKDGHLEITVQFATAEANPMAENVFQLVQQDMLGAVSVGFRPHEIRHERRDDRDVFILSDNELFEVSVVPIPANPDALRKMKTKAMAASAPAPDLDPPRERATTADGGKERNNMAQEENKATTDLLTKTVEKLQAELAQEKAKAATLEQRCADIEAERTKYKKQADEMLLAKRNKELDELVGKKIAPTEKATLLRMAELDADLYDKHLQSVRERPDMPHMKSDMLGPDPTPLSLSQDDGGDNLEKMVQRAAWGN